MNRNISLEYKGIKYNLDLESKITILSGDSGIGKTFLYKALSEYGRYMGSDSIIITINNQNIELFIDKIVNSINKVFVIDDANILLSEEHVWEINMDRNNKYIIMGRGKTLNGIISNIWDNKVIRQQEKSNTYELYSPYKKWKEGVV